MTAHRRRRARDTSSIAANLMLAPMVAAMRMPALTREAQSGGLWPAESMRAINEKTEAMAEGAFAAQMSLIQSAMGFWPELLAGKTPSMLSGAAAERFVHAGLKPASKKVLANYKRLSGKTR